MHNQQPNNLPHTETLLSDFHLIFFLQILTEDKKKKIFELAAEFDPGVCTDFQRDYERFKCHSEEKVLRKLRRRINRHCQSNYGTSALYNAVATGKSALLELLILIGTEIIDKNCCYRNPLTVALRLRHHAVVRILMENFDIIKPDCSGVSTLQTALMEERVETVKRLLSLRYQDITFTGEMDIIKFLLDKDDVVIIPQSQFSTLLLFAARIRNDDALKLVLSKSSTSNINAIGPQGNGLLKKLIDFDNIKMVNFLIENGVDLNANVEVHTFPNQLQVHKVFHPTSKVYTPLSYAIHTQTYVHLYPKDFNRIIDTFIATLAKMLVNGEYVSEKNIECIFRNEDLRSYHEKCEKEISRMKQEKIRGYSQICVYDILTRNLEKLAGLARNKMAFKRLNFKKYEKMFRIYRGEIQRNNERAIWRLEEIERIVEIFQYRVKLPLLIFHQILGYLNDIDLKKAEHYFSLLAEFLAQKH